MRARQALRVTTLCLGFGALAAGAQAQAPAHEHGIDDPHHIEARRASAAPAIDGVLDEAVWQASTVVDSFTQQEPSDGAPASTTGCRATCRAGRSSATSSSSSK